MKTIPIASDHAGFSLKEALKIMLKDKAYEGIDYGTNSVDSVDYPDFAGPVCRDILSGKADFGILICGTGNGMAMTANKFRGIRAALCWDPVIAQFARSHNNANILVLPARFMNEDTAKRCLDVFLETPFEGGRHENRILKMDTITEI